MSIALPAIVALVVVGIAVAVALVAVLLILSARGRTATSRDVAPEAGVGAGVRPADEPHAPRGDRI